MAGAVCLFFAAPVYVAGRFAYWDYQVSRERALIKERGEPTTLTEWQALCSAPAAGKDATELWLRGSMAIGKLFERPRRGELPPVVELGSRIPQPGRPREDIALSRQFMATIADAMADLHAAADLGGEAKYPLNVTQDMSDMRVGSLRRATVALALEANLRAHDDNTHGAADSLHAGLLLALSLRNEPTMAPYLTHMSCFSTIVSQFNTIRASDLPADDLAVLAEVISRFDFARSIKLAALGERVWAEYTFDHFNDSHPRFTRLYYARDEAAHLRLMAQFIEICDSPWNVKYATELGQRLGSAVEANEPRPLWTGLLTPSFEGVYKTSARAETQRRLAGLVIAIAQFEKRNGKPPVTLDELAPTFLAEIPTAAMTGQPFTYRATPDGYLLFSADHVSGFSAEYLDPETHTLPSLTFRWPPLPVKPRPTTDDE